MTGAARQAVVDRTVCVGSSWCATLAGGAFAIDPADGKARVLDPATASEDEVLEAVDSCPVAAISISEEMP